MGFFREIEGDLIKLAKESEFDAVTHGCNCFCTMGAGIAPLMNREFNCGIYPLEHPKTKGDINKLGQIDYSNWIVQGHASNLIVINSYTQYYYSSKITGKLPVDYEAITLCMRKINHIFKGKHIGLPLIGCGLAGGNWNIVKTIFQKELIDMNVTVVYYKK